MSDLAAHIFHPIALELMGWEDPPPAPWHRTSRPNIYRPTDKQGEVEPFNVQADWEEKGN